MIVGSVVVVIVVATEVTVVAGYGAGSGIGCGRGCGARGPTIGVILVMVATRLVITWSSRRIR